MSQGGKRRRYNLAGQDLAECRHIIGGARRQFRPPLRYRRSSSSNRFEVSAQVAVELSE